MDNFEIIPAIDILGGKCVRLFQGDYKLAEEFSPDPIEIAEKWINLGAKRLHVIDLDGAKEGLPMNFKTISKIAMLPEIKVQVGGGIRTHKSMEEYFEAGVNRVILGTKAFSDKDFVRQAIKKYGERIIVGLDLKDKKIALSGWQQLIDIDLNKIPELLEGVEEIIYTDVSKDGTLEGPDFKSLEEVSSLFKHEQKIIVSGGISDIGDVLKLIELKKKSLANISGVILGKSLYKGSINLSSAISSAKTALRETSL